MSELFKPATASGHDAEGPPSVDFTLNGQIQIPDRRADFGSRGGFLDGLLEILIHRLAIMLLSPTHFAWTNLIESYEFFAAHRSAAPRL